MMDSFAETSQHNQLNNLKIRGFRVYASRIWHIQPDESSYRSEVKFACTCPRCAMDWLVSLQCAVNAGKKQKFSLQISPPQYKTFSRLMTAVIGPYVPNHLRSHLPGMNDDSRRPQSRLETRRRWSHAAGKWLSLFALCSSLHVRKFCILLEMF